VRHSRHVSRAWLLGALALGACSGTGPRVPLPTFPQLQAVGEMSEYGTDRLRAGEQCRAASATVDAYVECMKGKGWEFIERGSLYPAPECWSARTTGDPRQMPAAQCFRPAPGAAAAPVAEP